VSPTLGRVVEVDVVVVLDVVVDAEPCRGGV